MNGNDCSTKTFTKPTALRDQRGRFTTLRAALEASLAAIDDDRRMEAEADAADAAYERWEAQIGAYDA